ncbi:TrmH family RNA methyltransferase [Nannocystaceae bacterium ST9]
MSDPLGVFRDLARRPRADGRFVVEGEFAVARLLESGFEVESIVCTPGARSRLAIPEHVQVFELANAALRELVGFDFHRGALACARRPEQWRVDPAIFERPTLTIVIAVALADPRNLGALIRNARAFAVDLVIVDAQGADPLSRVAIRASMGNVFRVPILIESLPGRIRELGCSLVAATPEPAAEDLHAFVRPDRLALLVGNEGDGLSPELLALADRKLRIPIAREADSLNVAAATAVLLDRLR